MSVTSQQLIPPAPATQRGLPLHLNTPEDGSRVAYGSQNSVVVRSTSNLFDCDLFVGHASDVTVAKFSRNGETICSGDISGRVLIWAPNHPEKLIILDKEGCFQGRVHDVDIDGKQKAWAMAGEGRKPVLIVREDGSQSGDMSGHHRPVLTVSCRQKRKFCIVTGSEDRTSKEYRGPPYHLTGQLGSFSGFVNCVQWSPDSEKVAVGGSENVVHIFAFQPDEFTLTCSLEGHTGAIYSLVWLSDTEIVSCSADKTVRFWDVSSSSCTAVVSIGEELACTPVGLYRDASGVSAVTLGGDIAIVGPEGVVSTHPGHSASVSSVAVSDDGNHVISVDLDGKVIRWGLEDCIFTSGYRYEGYHRSGIVDVAIVSGHVHTVGTDCQYRVTPLFADALGVETELPAVPVSLVSTDSGLFVVLVDRVLSSSGDEIPGGRIEGAEYSCALAAGETLFLGSVDGQVHQFSIQDGTLGLERSFEGRPRAIRAMAVHNGKLAIGGAGCGISLLDLSSGEFINRGRYDFHSGALTSIQWVSDDCFISAGAGGDVFAFSVAKSLRKVKMSKVHRRGVNMLLPFKGKYISCGVDGAMRVLDVVPPYQP